MSHVMCNRTRVMCHMFFFLFFQSGWIGLCRVCYQRTVFDKFSFSREVKTHLAIRLWKPIPAEIAVFGPKALTYDPSTGLARPTQPWFSPLDWLIKSTLFWDRHRERKRESFCWWWLWCWCQWLVEVVVMVVMLLLVVAFQHKKFPANHFMPLT